MAGGAPRSTSKASKAPEQEHLHMTWSMHLCFWYAVLANLLMLGCLVGGGVNPRYEGHVEADVWHAAIAILLIFSLAVTELCIVFGGASQGELLTTVGGKVAKGSQLTLPGTHDAYLTLLEYLIKLVTGAYLYFFSGGVVHVDALAVNGNRPVYMARFAQWSVAVPIIVLITNAAFQDFGPALLRRSWPSLAAAFTFVWAGWLMEVTPHHQVRWPMMMLSLSGAVCVALDQFQFASKFRSELFFNVKFGLLVYAKVVDCVYATVFLMGRFGVISSGNEMMYYAYADASMKVFHGALLAMIRNREGTSEINRWFVAAMSAGDNLRELVSQTTIPILTIDLQGNIMEWNDSLSQLTGFLEFDVQGKNIIDLCTNDSREDLRRNLERRMDAFRSESASLDAESSLLEVCLMTDTRKDEDLPPVRTLAMSIAAKRNSAGVLEGVTAIGQDLSEISDLKMVQERKDALLAMLGHEIRSPLHGIMGLTSALLEDPENKPLIRHLGMVKGCAARLLDLVNNVMDLAQSEKKKMEGVEEARPDGVVDLSSIVDEAIVMIGNSVDKTNKPLLKAGIRLMNAAAGTKIPLVRGNAYKCTQLIYNLLTNAAKFTDRGSITVSFRHLSGQGRLEVDITDTGKGISEAGQKRIFQPFEQEMRGDCRSFQGIGLGLAVCKEIAELHQGSLKVKSVVGQGSTFTLSLPCDVDLGYVKVEGESVGNDDTLVAKPVTESTATVSVEVPTSEAAQSTPHDFKNKPVILSVDDDEVNQEVIQNALGEFCDVKIAMSGAEALEYFDLSVKAETPFPELVLLDIQMPGMSGFQVCEKIRATYEKSLSKLPVTMLSAKLPSEAAALQSYDCGCTDFVAKPFNTHLLRKKVMAALKMREHVGVSGITVLTSEAQKMIKGHEEVAKKAVERTSALELELHELKTQASKTLDRANALEKENTSLQRANDCQKEEMSSIAKERDDAQKRLRFSQTLPAPAHSKTPKKHASQMDGSDDSTTCHVQSARETSNMRIAVEVLASRLNMCRRSAKQCKQLLSGSRLTQSTDSRSERLADLHSQQHEPQTKMLIRLVKVTEMELTVIEHVASKTEDIMHLIEHDGSSKYDTSDEQSTSSLGRQCS
eukprot:TRINITY_DN5740_c0_g2_i1.p1 TRINITY_DN5740_c0_g2~~TRINITY_DN5740_c0_g2_i1.p1  ORF type:complete len:1114 (-),score=180.37 TRINITY_DN5740_c0_g2_i1:11-3352(-)